MSQPGAAASAAPVSRVARVVAGLLVLAATVLVALVESFLVVLRVGTVRMPVSVVLALVLHPALTSTMRRATASRGAAFLPFLGWLLVVGVLGAQRTEGDLIITGNNWVASVLIVGGALAFVVSLALVVPSRRPAGGSLGGDGSP